MDRFKQFLDASGILSYLNGRDDETAPVYLVGGALRDCLQGHVVADLDFIMPVDPTDCAKGMAHLFNGTWFMLDQTRNQSRVVMTIDNERIVCDFAPFRAPSLDEDLRDRDFTINALAWPCSAPSISDHIHDPLGGIDDLENRRLRTCNDQSFLEDPLRTLKAVRHATCLNLCMDDKTLTLLKDAVSNLDQIAPERIRAELAKILSSDNAVNGILLLSESGLLAEVFGQSTQSDEVSITVERLDRLESLLSDVATLDSTPLKMALSKDFEEFLQLSSILKLSVFCRSYKPIALENVLRALRFSSRTIGFLMEMQAFDLDGCLASLAQLPATTRGQARWVANLGREPLGVLCMLKTEMLAQQMDLTSVDHLADSFFTHSENGRLSDLVDGNWLCTTYQLKPGPKVGRLHKALQDAELSGEISTTQEARKWLWDNQKTIDNILLEKL